jgi:DNA-binding XRE family transcriptional regulator
MKAYDYDDMLNKELENPEFRKEYEALQEEFDVAKQVIGLRLKKGMTQKELAEKVHTSQSCIARLESGSYRNLSLSFLRRVGRALDVEPHVIFRQVRPAH